MSDTIGKPDPRREVIGADGKTIKRGTGRPRSMDMSVYHEGDEDLAVRAEAKRTNSPKQSLPMLMKILALPPIDDNDPAQVGDRIAEFFNICMEHGFPATKEALALSFKVERRTLYYWLDGHVKSKPRDVVDLLGMACAVIDTSLATDGLVRGDNPAFRIFLMRNSRAGYTNDEGKLEANEMQIEDRKNSAEEIARKYEDMVED